MLRRREMLVPTWRGWLALLLVIFALGTLTATGLPRFLAVNHPLPAGVLVVEGWMPDYAMEAAAAEFQKGRYELLAVTGGPLEKGAPLVEFKTWAELGAATFHRLGLDTNQVRAVPAPPVAQDRTYASAVTLREWLRQRGDLPAAINVVSAGAHSRRTRLLFQKAFGDQTRIGILAVPDRGYDQSRWWRTSQGVRTMISETVAYLYARFLFRPKEE